MKFASGMLVGYILCWITFLIIAEYKIRRDEVINELMEENHNYKRIIDNWRDKYDSD